MLSLYAGVGGGKEDNMALEDGETQYARRGHRGVHRARGVPTQSPHSPSRLLKFPFHGLCAPLPQTLPYGGTIHCSVHPYA